MRMSKERAVQYAFGKCRRSSGEEHDVWTRIYSRVERDGLEEEIADLQSWMKSVEGMEEHAASVSIVQGFLVAVEDDVEIEPIIAAHMHKKLAEEIKQVEALHLRVLYLKFLQDFYLDVRAGRKRLSEYKGVMTYINTLMTQLEQEYHMWVDSVYKELEWRKPHELSR